MSTLLISSAVLGGLGLFFGLMLSYFSTIMKVEEPAQLTALKALLPGAGCGGCGFAGCAAFAEKLYAGKADYNGCPVGGADLTKSLADVMGANATAKVPVTAFVKCLGTDKLLYNYSGVASCRAALRLAGGGSRACAFGCLGGGDCFRVCKFGAIQIANGTAIVDSKKCVGCNICVASCPKELIVMVPQDKTIRVGCNAQNGGKSVRASCNIGCIGCRLCAKSCEYDAVRMEESLAVIDYEKCTGCGVCAQICPRKCIQGNNSN